MSVFIQNNSAYPLTQDQLEHGVIYEGSDKELYVAIDPGLSHIRAVGINTQSWIDNRIDHPVIHFREVIAKIDYQ